MKKIIISVLAGLSASTCFAKEYPIQANMIKPEMQNAEYQVDQIDMPNHLGTLVCDNGSKVKIYNKSEIFVGGEEGWNAKKLIHLSIFGDLIANAIESDSVFVGNATPWPIIVGAEVAKEGIVKYSENNQVDPDKRAKALNVTAGISTGSTIANIAIALGASNPAGAFVGIVGGVFAYNQANKQYELEKMNAGKIKVLTFMPYPTDSTKAFACE